MPWVYHAAQKYILNSCTNESMAKKEWGEGGAKTILAIHGSQCQEYRVTYNGVNSWTRSTHGYENTIQQENILTTDFICLETSSRPRLSFAMARLMSSLAKVESW